MIIATAGHVDHGKSTLVRRLTGTDPDRWAEERSRGLTIDLGFAWTELASGRTAAFVDVPGHRRFVANALSGCATVDGVVLAVSAREGWMAQTEEHVAILGLLGAPTGIVALTFCDDVGPDQRRRVEDALRVHLAGTFLDGAAVVAMSADGGGDERLLLALDAAIVTCPTAEDRGRPRLWVDRSFLLDGVGRVVTGSLTGGCLTVGDRLRATDGTRFTEVRVRSVHEDGRPVDRARPGTRVALGVRADGSTPERGQAVVRPEQWASGRLLHVAMQPARGGDLPPARGSYLVHLGTWSSPARLSYPANAAGFARLHLDRRSGPFAPGDRFVLRDAGRNRTVAGGAVVAVDPAASRYPAEALAGRAAAVAAPAPLRARRLAAALLAERGGIAPAAAVLAATGERQPVGTRVIGGSVVAVPALRRSRVELEAQLTAEGTISAVGDGLGRLAADSLVERGVALARDGAFHHRAADLDAAWQAAVDALDAATDAGRLPCLFTREQAAGVGVAPRDLGRLVEQGRVVDVPPFAVTRSVFLRLAAVVRARLAEGPATTAELKTALGLTRKHAIPLLEGLDAQGMTRRIGTLRHQAEAGPDA